MRLSFGSSNKNTGSNLPAIGTLIVACFMGFRVLEKVVNIRNCKNRLMRKHAELRKARSIMHANLDVKMREYSAAEMSEIIRLSGHELAKKMQNDEISVKKVLTAFQQRCHQIENTNFLAEYLDNTDALAEKLESMKLENRKNYALFGLPISMKECIGVAGKDQTCGLVKHTLKPAVENSVIYKVLVDCKALPFVTTSMARAGMSHDSSNPVFGDQIHPKFPTYSAGGSSGGEGIALSNDASVIGVGTDIGGSVRFPPAFNGICGINPTRNRISTKGIFIPGGIPRIDLKITVGPMARHVDDLALFFKAVLCERHFELDHTVVPKKFNMEKYQSSKPLTIGFYDSFNSPSMAEPVPSVKRGVRKACQILKAAGHKVEEVYLPNPYEWFTLALKGLFHDGGVGLVETLDNEPIPLMMEINRRILSLPRCVKKLLIPFYQRKLGKSYDPIKQSFPGLADSIEAAQLLRDIQTARENFTSIMRQYDAIVCPLFPIPVPKKGHNDAYCNASSSYSIIYNMLNNPAGAVCVDRVTAADNDHSMVLARKFKCIGDNLNAVLHEMQTQVGLPLCAQVVSKPFSEEVVLRVMKIIEDGAKFDYTK